MVEEGTTGMGSMPSDEGWSRADPGSRRLIEEVEEEAAAEGDRVTPRQ